MMGKCSEISETFKRCCVDICCLQEVRWKGQGAKMIGNGFKFLWSVCCKEENGESVIVANWLIGKVVGVERHNKVIKVNIVIGDVVWEHSILQPSKLGEMASGKKLLSYMYYLMAVRWQKFQCVFFVVSIIKSHEQMLKCFLQMIFLNVTH